MADDKILNAFLESSEINGFVENISKIFNCPILVIDCAFHIVSSFASADYASADYKTAVSHGELSFEASAAISEDAEKATSDFFITKKGSSCYRVYNLTVGDTTLGYMICVFEDGASLNSPDSDFEFAARLTAKQLYLERRQIVKSTAEEILTELLDGEFSDREHFELRAFSTYLSNFKPNRLAVIDLDGYAGGAEADGFLRRILESDFHASHPFLYKNRIVMFIHKDHDINRLSEIAKSERLGITVSGELQDIFSAKAAYESANEALCYLLTNKKGGFCEQGEKYALLLSLKKLADKDGMIDSTVLELARYDSENSSELTETLYTYLSCHHSLKTTCEKLYTHRNTVLYRINKITETYKIDLDDPNKYLRYLLSAALVLVKNGRDEIFI